jgi:hypothetical protein
MECWFLKGKYPFFILPSAQHFMIPEPIIPMFQRSIIAIGAKYLLPFVIGRIKFSAV